MRNRGRDTRTLSQCASSDSLASSVDLDQELGAQRLSDEAYMNGACDDYAGNAGQEHVECPESLQQPVLEPPYEGVKAILKIGKMWITSHYDDNIHFASSAPPLRQYCKQRHDWSEDTLNLIDFDVIGRIRKQLKWTDKSRTMKVLHGWLAVMHNMGKRNGITQCPGCPCEDETFLHLFSCKHS